MQHEHSVVTALAELARLEQERVDGERRTAAEQRVQNLERDLARQAAERADRELTTARARIVAQHEARLAEHEARASELHARIAQLQARLASADGACAALRDALTSRGSATGPTRATVWLATAAACALGLIAFAQHHELAGVRRELQVRAHVNAMPVVPPHRTHPDGSEFTAPAPLSAMDSDKVTRGATETVTTPKRPSRVAQGNSSRPGGGGRTKVERNATTQPDPLSPIALCDGNDDPTCGL